MDYAYLVTSAATIAVIAGTALYTDEHLRSQQNVQAAAPAPQVSSSPTPQISPIPVPTLAPIRMPSAAGSVRPVSGRQNRGFSSQPVFWQGLDCWQVAFRCGLGRRSGRNRHLHARRRGALLCPRRALGLERRNPADG